MPRPIALALLLALPPAPLVAAAGPRLLDPGVVARGGSETHATLSPDGSTLFFLELTPDFARWTLVQARRCASGWCDPEVAWFSGRWDDADLSFSPDGRDGYRELGERLRSPGNGLFDLYVIATSELGIESPCGALSR